MDLDLKGRHALVCGGSDGIGRAAAHELALLGADVTVLARRQDALREVAATLPKDGGQQHGWIAGDVSQTDALRAQVEALANGKPVHILVNNTGGPPGGPAHQAQPAAFLDAFNKHLIANQALVQALLPGMRAAAWGRIVNVISTSVKEPIVGLGVSNTVRGRWPAGPRPCRGNSRRWASPSTTSCRASRTPAASRNWSATARRPVAKAKRPSPMECASSFPSAASPVRRKLAA